MDARTARADDAATAALGALADLPATVAAQALAAACDLVLVIDAAGMIRELRIGQDDLSGLGLESWLNQHFADVVAPENRTKVAEMLEGTSEAGRWRHVNHPTPGGDVPVRYLMLAGNDGGHLAIGRDMRPAAALQQRLLRAQQAMERDSLRLRQLEARYRLLFDTATEAVLVLDVASRRIIDANPAARRLAGMNGVGLEGQAFSGLLHDEDREEAVAMLGAVAAAEQRHPGRVRLASGQSCLMSASLFRQDRTTHLLVRLRSLDSEPMPDRPLREVLERMPDAFVLTDADLGVLACNGAFLDLVHEARGEDVTGTPLPRWLGRPGIDVGLLEAQLREHGTVSNFSTIIRPKLGSDVAVEVSAVKSHDGDAVRHGFTIRSVVGRTTPVIASPQPRSVEQLTELVGRVSLKEIVRESTDLIERLCIEAALSYTQDNRASAAEILGLSRQSLYSKLHRHGLGNLGDPE